MRTAEVVLVLPLDASVDVALGKELEVSLDCSYCRRTDRTIIFKLGAPVARCCPGSAKRADEDHPPYPGRLVDLDVRRGVDGSMTATYRLEYDVTPFEDVKYGPDLRPWTGHPTFARVRYALTCPACKEVVRSSTQSNIVRPWTQGCRCGYQFYIERREMPLLRWLNPRTGKWCQVPERFGARQEEPRPH
jgi:hypothetical protein